MQAFNPYAIVERFEREMAEFTGAPNAVAVDTGTAALLLCLKYAAPPGKAIEVPKRTFCGVANAVIQAGCRIRFVDRRWTGSYQLAPLPIVDSACRLEENMYAALHGQHVCLSFQSRKPLPIGRGGMILTGEAAAARWFRAARWHGRNEHGEVVCEGFPFRMEPERAAKGLELMQQRLRDGNYRGRFRFDYPDLSRMEYYRRFTVSAPIHALPSPATIYSANSERNDSIA